MNSNFEKKIKVNKKNKQNIKFNIAITSFAP